MEFRRDKGKGNGAGKKRKEKAPTCEILKPPFGKDKH